MKKFLSFFAALLFAGSMMAADYVKVTTAPTDWSGDYLIVYETTGVAFNGGATTLDAVENSVAVAVSDGKIAASETTNAAKFTIAAVEGGYSIQAANGKYIGVSSNSNGLKTADEVGSYIHTLSLSEEGNARIYAEFEGSTMYLRYNKASNQLRFRYFKNEGQEPVALYKYTESEETHTYTIAGSSTDLFGTAWDPTNTANDMALQEDNTYKWEKADLTLAAGNVSFKVAEDHAWDVAYPASDYVLNIPEAGVYTITITYNPAHNNAVNAVAQKTGSAVVIPTVAMHGNFGGQNWADTENFAVAEGNETASLTLNLAAGDYEFGMRIGGAGNWTANGAAFTRENNAAVIEAGQGNITLDADAAGEYTFTWTYATNTLTVTYPEYVEPTYTYTDGYYLIGLDMQDWTLEYMPTEGRLFAANPDNEGEYQLTITLADAQQFKVVSVQKDHIKSWYPDGMDNNYIVDAAHAGEKTVYFRPDGQGGEGWHYGVIYVAANEEQPEQPEMTTIYDWAGEIGTTIIGASSVTLDNVKIHTNTDNVPAIKFASSYVYADGKYIAIKPSNGGFKAGDVLSVAAVFSNSSDAKYAQVDVYAADGATRIFRSDSASTINGRTKADDPIVQTYTLASDQDSLLLGRYGNTSMFVTLLKVERAAGEEPVETPKFYVTGNAALVGQDKEWNPSAIQSMNDTLVLNLEAGIDYVLKVAVNGTWEGENNVKGYNELTEKTEGLLDISNDHNIGFRLNEAGEVKIVYIAAAEEQPEVFKLIGNFYVAPKVAYYLIGDSAFVVDAGATADKAWTPDAIPCLKDTTVLNLKAGVDYIMRLSLNGTWENHRDFRHLTDTAAGLIELPDEFGNHSIGFRLAEAGEVKVVYIAAAEEQPEVFKLEGNFYVAPTPVEAKYYLTGDSALVVDAALTADKAWAPNAIKVEQDTMVLNLKADQEYKLKLTVDGTWNTGKGYDDLTVKADGLTKDNDNNIVFTLAEAGAVTVIYNDTTFKLEGNFYVAPTPVEAKYYLTGDSALVVDGAALAAEKAWVPNAIKVENDTMTLSLLANQEYKLKLTVDGTWNTGKGYDDLTVKADGLTKDNDGNIVFTLAEAGAVTVIYNDTIFKLEGQFKVSEPEIVYGIFLVGSFTEWQFLDNYRFSINPANEAEYIITKTLNVGDKLKVVKVVNDVATWYPDGTGNEYTVDAAHAGEKTIYFRTTYNEAWAEFGGYIWIDANAGTGIDAIDANGKAVKVLRDGMILIIRDGKTYNAQGMLVK